MCVHFKPCPAHKEFQKHRKSKSLESSQFIAYQKRNSRFTMTIWKSHREKSIPQRDYSQLKIQNMHNLFHHPNITPITNCKYLLPIHYEFTPPNPKFAEKWILVIFWKNRKKAQFYCMNSCNTNPQRNNSCITVIRHPCVKGRSRITWSLF